MTYPADLYAAVHCGNDGDVHFYRRVASDALDVLELGCGHGRIAKALASDGCRVVGVDIDADALSLAKGSGATLLQGDIREVRLGKRFDRVIAPYNLLYCMLSERDLVRCLSTAAAHLQPHGLFVCDVWSADGFHAEADRGEDSPDLIKTVDVRGIRWDVFEHAVWLPDTQRIDAHYRYVPRDGSSPIDCVIPQRYILSEQVESVFEEAGLKVVALLGGFDDSAYDAESEHLIVVAAPVSARV